MDAEEQQVQEIEALQAIFSEEEIEVVSNEYPNIEIRFTLSSVTQGSSQNDDDFSLVLVVSLPSDYPEVIPSLHFDGWEDEFRKETIDALESKLNDVASENVGMALVFTVISALQDEIGNLLEERKKEKELAVELEKQKIEEKEKKRFIGTPVTVESFQTWKQEFDKMRLALKEKQVKEREAALAGKLTGKQQFIRDATLNLSDATIMNENAQVDIDESLFDDDDLEGLDIEDEELEAS